MTTNETRLSRRDAERLLDAPAADASPLGWALSSASAPAHPAELRREDATVAAFHTARLSPRPARRRAFVSPTRLASRAAIHAVVATGAVVAVASGGFALAGSLDLPSLPGQASDRATGSVSRTPKPVTPAESAEGSESDSSTRSATPSPNFQGLCKAFRATDRTTGGSLDSAAFRALAAEAGATGTTGAGRVDQIATYCVGLIGQSKAGKHTGKPSPTGKPTDKHTGRPTDKPRPGKPTDRPRPSKPTDAPEQSGTGGEEDSTTSGS